MCRHVYSLVIDTQNYSDAIYEETIKKVGVKVKPQLKPYDVAWITNTKAAGYQRCLVSFFVCKFRDTVICDFYLILRHTSLWDPHVQDDASANTYWIIKGNTKYTLTCAIDMLNLNLTKTSLVIQRLFFC